MRTKTAAFLVAGLIHLGCGDPSSTPLADAGSDAVHDADATPDTTPGDASGDGSDIDAPDVSGDVTEGPPCVTHRQCQSTETPLCLDGTCQRGPACNGPADWADCRAELVAVGIPEDRASTAVCVRRQCVVPCYYDTDCAEDETCTDYGRCVAFTNPITGVHPGGDSRAPLQAGFGEALLNFPIGVPMGGWTQRAANNDGRYAVSLAASHGIMQRLFARAVVLDNGERQIAILRVPLIFSSQTMHEALAQHLYQRTGRDWRHSLVLSSTHTHSGPARFWEIPADGAASIGVMGIGEYSQDVYEWLLGSMKDALDAALDDLAPARLGWTIVEAYDVPDVVGRDRWYATPPFDDNRALLIRIDDADGVPRAALFSYGAHGTDALTTYFTEDAPGGAERAIEALFGEHFGRFVPAMFVNQNSGSMSPAGDAIGHRFPQSGERVGEAFVQAVGDAFLELATRDDVRLGGVTHRFLLEYDSLGYDGDWAGHAVPEPFGGVYRNGAFQCGGPHMGDEDYGTHADIHDLACVAIHFLVQNRPPTLFSRAQMTALDIDGLTVVTAPGELSMELSWQILRALRDELGVDPLKAWTWGYAQGHLLYLLPYNLRGEDPPFPGQRLEQPLDDYPDFAFSFLQGGYEPTMSPWGPRAGDYYTERAVEAVARLLDPDRAAAAEDPLPQVFSPRVRDAFEVLPTADADVGTIVEDVPPTVERLQTIEFAWVGGDPGAEVPQAPLVRLERWDGAAWQGLNLPSHRPYDSSEPRFALRVRARAAGRFEWVARWEELQDFPVGRYRLAVQGHRQTPAGAIAPYEVASSAFELVASSALVVSAELGAGTLSGTVAYPAAENMRFPESLDDPARVTGNYRMRHFLVPPGTDIPLEADVNLVADDIVVRFGAVTVGPVTLTTVYDGPHGGPVTRFDAPVPDVLAGDPLTIEVTDLFGNTGRLEP